jgi:biopolymer transport protein ExbD
MAEVNTGGGGEAKKGKPKKQHLRVDFTPMVDMNMLLITFFMFCTTLAKPQTMDLVMPAKEENLTQEDKSKVKDENAITVILGEKNKVYYYLGKPKYDDYSSLKKVNYNGADDKNSLRSMLLEQNKYAVNQVKKLRQMKYAKEISEENYKVEIRKIKDAKDGKVVMIKPTEGSTYKNFIDALDEMQICCIGKYSVEDPKDPEMFLIKNFETSGAYFEATK